MRQNRVLAMVACLALAGPGSGVGVMAQDADLQLIPAPHMAEPLAETLFQRGFGESRAAVIGAESDIFANRMAAIYMGGTEGESWRDEVARIHDPARVAALLLAAVQRELDRAGALDPDLVLLLGATGVDVAPDGEGMILAARIQLARPGALEGVALRMRADEVKDAPVLAAIDAMIDAEDPESTEMARSMNRQLAFATGFAEAEGFDFPASPDDAAADLTLQMPELLDEATMRIRLSWYAAYAPLGAAAVDRSAVLRARPGAEALRALLDRAESDVLAQLGRETGRAAARRMKGTRL